MSEDDFENFLATSKASGTHDSEGEFTMVLEEARRKAARYSLRNEGDWAVKVLQALYASEIVPSPGIKIACRADSTLFTFRLRKTWKPKEIEKVLLGSGDSRNRAFEHLARGLLTVGVGQNRRVRVCASGDRTVLTWDSGELSFSKTGQGDLQQQMFIQVDHLSAEEKLSANSSVGSKRRLKLKRLTNVLTMVRRRVIFHQYPLTLDGRKLDYISQLEKSLEDKGLISLLYSAESYRCAEWYRRLTEPEKKIRARWGKKKTEAPRLPELTCLAANEDFVTRVIEEDRNTRDTKAAPSEVHWLCDGVIVGQDSLTLPKGQLSIQVYRPAEGLTHDFSGLKLIESPERTAELESIESGLRQGIPTLELPELDKALEAQAEANVSQATTGGVLGFGIAALLVMKFGFFALLHKQFGGILLGTIFGTATFGGIGAGQSRGIDDPEKALQRLREALEIELQDFQKKTKEQNG